MSDYFTRKAIAAIAADLPEAEKARLRAEVRDRRLSPAQTLNLVVACAEGPQHELGAPSPALTRGTALQAAHDATARYLGGAP